MLHLWLRIRAPGQTSASSLFQKIGRKLGVTYYRVNYNRERKWKRETRERLSEIYYVNCANTRLIWCNIYATSAYFLYFWSIYVYVYLSVFSAKEIRCVIKNSPYWVIDFQYWNIYALLGFLFDTDVIERATVAFVTLVQFEQFGAWFLNTALPDTA